MWTTENRRRYDRDQLRYPSDLTDLEWEEIEPLIPPAKRGGGKLHFRRRVMISPSDTSPPSGVLQKDSRQEQTLRMSPTSAQYGAGHTLTALKLYLLFVAMRDNDTNLAMISYDRIGDYTDIDRHQIKPALSVLAANGVVHIEHIPASGDYGIANAYRIAFIEERQHFGTTLRGRSDLADLLGKAGQHVQPRR